MTAYPHLFTPGKIGHLTIPNRVIMPAMGTVLCNADGSVSHDQIAYYEERALGGTGLIVTEIVAVENRLGRAVAVQTRADSDRYIPGLARLASAIHKYPTRVFPQLHHAGNQSTSTITGGEQIVSASDVTSGGIGERPRGLTTEEIKDLVRKFVQAAVRCKTAGFDGVQLHGAHGYLINQFLSPHTNLRQDEYGGSFENRMRFVSEIVRGIKHECGSDFPVMVRFSADEFLPDGIDLEEGKRIARHLESIGTDCLDVSCGTYETMQTLLEPIAYDEAWRVYLAEAIKAEVSIPVVTVGVIRWPRTAERVLADGRADFVAIGRNMLTDPEWTNKAREGREEEICQCIACLHCIETIFAARPIECAVNARTGREYETPEPPRDGDGRKVAIIGGGPGGMEAARVLARRGFAPIVFEKESELGGELVPGCKPPKKEKIAWYNDFMKNEMARLSVDVRMNTHATPEMVAAENPHAVIVAVGAVPFIPRGIPGVPGENVHTFQDVLWGRTVAAPGQKVLVVGGGYTGCETAELLAHQGASVVVMDMLPEIAVNEHVINRISTMEHLRDAGVSLLPSRKLVGYSGGRADIEPVDGGNHELLEADLVVIAMGLRVDEQMVEPWTQRFENARVIGDAVSPRKVAQAVREGYDAAWVMRGPVAEAPQPSAGRRGERRVRPRSPEPRA